MAKPDTCARGTCQHPLMCDSRGDCALSRIVKLDIKPDISAYELAQLLQLMGPLGLNPNPFTPPSDISGVPQAIRRHFKVV